MGLNLNTGPKSREKSTYWGYLLMITMKKKQQPTNCCILCACVWPPPSNSDQEDYYMFTRGFLSLFATVIGREPNPMYTNH